MFKDSFITRLEPWSTVEESDAMPGVCFPAFVGTGRLGMGLDAAGLQSLPECLGDHYDSPFVPFHRTQGDLYILREGMISAHLWDDEIKLTGATPAAEHAVRESMRNFMPLGYVTQTLEFDGEVISGGDLKHRPQRLRLEGADVRRHARMWRRDWDLRAACVRTRYELGIHKRIPVAVEVFAPYGGRSFYIKLTRGAFAGREGSFTWSVALNLQTRHGLPIFDQKDAVTVGQRTLLGQIDRSSAHNPAEPYAMLYGVAAEGMTVQLTTTGWSATMSGPLAQEQSAWLRMDFMRHAGVELREAAAHRDALEKKLVVFNRRQFETAWDRHREEFEAFWQRTADVAVEDPQPADVRRAFMLHMSEYLLRCGNEHSRGGTVQFMLMHQNGWRACNFHDHHYIVDGLARANLWREAEDHARWMLSVMHREGRPFPWMMTYDGYAPIPPEVDRAPMSDANRALLAIRLYELAGTGRDDFLRATVYPIVRAVAEHGATKWFYEHNRVLLFRAVENDVMNETPRMNESGTVLMYLSVLRKAVAYSEFLNVDGDRRENWRRIADAVRLQKTPDGRYRAWRDSPDDARGNDFFLNAVYVAEAQEWLETEALRRSRDFGQRIASCNFAWLNASATSSEIRLDRPDRGEQFMVDTLENTIHGPGYFEEVVPNGVSALPPFGTAHGSFVCAVCEQVVLPDFWRARVYVGRGLPSSLRTRTVVFRSLRALRGLLISGRSTPRELAVEIENTGDAFEVEMVLRIPCDVGVRLTVTSDGAPVDHVFGGESVSIRLALAAAARARLLVRG